MFDDYFLGPGGGILSGRLNDPATGPNSPQQWGGPGGYGLADVSTGDRPVSAYAQGKLGGFQALPALLGFGLWPPTSTASTNPMTSPTANSMAGSPGGVQQPASPAPARAAATPSPGDALGTAAPAGTMGSDFLARLGQALHDNSSMLMAMGGGMMTGGIGKGLQAGAAAAADAASKRQAPQTVKVRAPGGGEMLMMWDPGQRRYVPAPVAGLQPTGGGAPAPAATGGYAEGTTATNPQTGQRVIFENRKW
jgi:hypothetical protein